MSIRNQLSQRDWLLALLREVSDAGKRLSQVELQDIAEDELGHPFPKYTARMSELRDALFPDEAIFCERVPTDDAEVWEYWIGPMTADAREKYLANRGEKTVSLLTVTFEDLVDLVEIVTGHDYSDCSTAQLRGFAEHVEAHLTKGTLSLVDAVKAAAK